MTALDSNPCFSSFSTSAIWLRERTTRNFSPPDDQGCSLNNRRETRRSGGVERKF